MEQYTQEQLNQFDDIINRLANGQNVSVDESLQPIYSVLADRGWISNKTRYESLKFYAILKTPEFNGLLAGGTFSERYKRKIGQQQQPSTVQNFYGGNNNVGNNNAIITENKGKISTKQGNTEIERKSFFGTIFGAILSFFKCD